MRIQEGFKGWVSVEGGFSWQFGSDPGGMPGCNSDFLGLGFCSKGFLNPPKRKHQFPVSQVMQVENSHKTVSRGGLRQNSSFLDIYLAAPSRKKTHRNCRFVGFGGPKSVPLCRPFFMAQAFWPTLCYSSFPLFSFFLPSFLAEIIKPILKMARVERVPAYTFEPPFFR